MAFLGLSAQEFSDIHEAVAEGMAFVELPVTFWRANPAALDDLYREASDGDDGMDAWATIDASIRFDPDEETLTRMGLKDDVDLLMFIPRQNVVEWEEENEAVFEVKRSMEFDCYAGRFEVSKPPRTDPLPVGDGSSTDYIGMIVVGKEARP